MYTLFTAKPTAKRGGFVPTDFPYVRSGLLRNIDRYVAYYQTDVFAVPSEHFLVRLLDSIVIDSRPDYYRMVDMVDDLSDSLSRSLRMTSSVYRGEVKKYSVFYGDKCHEILISASEDFSIDDAIKNWRDLRPIRILRHPYNDLSMPVLNGKSYSDRQGLAVISINIPMLALQHRRWLEEEAVVNAWDTHSTKQFVVSYPIINMIYSHLDLAVFNRQGLLFKNLPVDRTQSVHPYYQIDYADKLDASLRKTNAFIEQGVESFNDILVNTPSITEHDLFDVMRLPRMAITRQVVTALTLARLPLVNFLLAFDKTLKNSPNSLYLNKMALALREMRYDGQLLSALPPYVVDELRQEIATRSTLYQ